MSNIDDRRIPFWINYLEQLEQKELKQLELRYQVALIIIPTIIGFWGFIGLIATSNLFEEHPLFIDICATIGMGVTFFLIWVWRNYVHDILNEELEANRQHIIVEAEVLLRERSDEDLNDLIEEDLLRKYPVTVSGNGIRTILKKKLPQDFYKALCCEKKLYKFYRNYALRLSDNGYSNIEGMMKKLMIIFGYCGILFPFCLFPFISRDVETIIKIVKNFIFLSRLPCDFLSIFFTTFFSVTSAIALLVFLKKFNELINEVKPLPGDSKNDFYNVWETGKE